MMEHVICIGQVPSCLDYSNNLLGILKEIRLFVNKDHTHELVYPYMFVPRISAITKKSIQKRS